LGVVIGTDVQAHSSVLHDLTTSYVPASTSGAASISLGEDTDNGTNKVTIAAPSSLSSNYTLTLPDSAGTSGYVLSTDGTGVTSWSASGSGAPATAKYIVQTADATLSNEQALGDLSTGLLKNTMQAYMQNA
jgi:hypothetical protein